MKKNFKLPDGTNPVTWVLYLLAVVVLLVVIFRLDRGDRARRQGYENLLAQVQESETLRDIEDSKLTGEE